MRYEYEDPKDLGSEGTYAREKQKVREEGKADQKKENGLFK